MTRGQQTQTYNTDQQVQQQAGQQAQASLAPVAATDNAILANPGYTPAQQSSMTNSAMGGMNSAYDALASKATDSVAKTNNAAGYNELMDKLARDRGSAAASTNANLQGGFANDAQQQTAQAVNSLQGLYGTQTGASLNALNQQGTQAASNKGFWDTFGTNMAGSLGTGVGAGIGALV